MAYVKRIRRELHPNQALRTYSVTIKLTSKEIRLGNDIICDKPLDAFVKADGLTDVVKNFVGQLAVIPGIECVYLKQYSVVIHKGFAFNWNEIEPQVIYHLKELFKAIFDSQSNDDIQVDFTMKQPPMPSQYDDEYERS